MPKHIGIVAVSAEGAALCYRTVCVEGAAAPASISEASFPSTILASRLRFATARQARLRSQSAMQALSTTTARCAEFRTGKVPPTDVRPQHAGKSYFAKKYGLNMFTNSRMFM